MIVECGNRKFILNGTEVHALIVKCDQCSSTARRHGRDHGEAADKAREEGFITIPGAGIGSPRSWLCGDCARPRGV